MELGTAIFSSVVLICIVALVIALRDKIRWRRLFAYLLLIFTILGFGIYFYNQPFLWRGEITELDGLEIGESEADLLFKKGTYVRLCKRPDGKNEYAFLKEEYGDKKYTVVAIVDGQIRRISKPVSGSVYWDGRNSVTSYDNEESLRNKFGNEDFIATSTNSYRMYIWRNYNLMIGLVENKVSNLAVFDPKYYYMTPDWRNPNPVNDDCYDAKGAKMNYFDIYKPKP